MIPAALPILFEAVLRALLAACVLGGILRLLRVRNVPAQKAAWGLVLVAAMAMPLLMRWEWLPCWVSVKLPTASFATIVHSAPVARPSSSLPASPLRRPDPATQPDQGVQSNFAVLNRSVVPDRSGAVNRFDLPPISDYDFPAPQSAATDPAVEVTPIPVPASAPPVAQPPATSLLPRVFSFGRLLYLCVGAALLFRLFFALISSIRVWLSAKPIDVLTAPGIPPSIDVRSSRQIASPVNIGSSILLPVDYITWDDEKLRVVLAHEYAHIRQRDYYLQLLAGLYAAITWFSPLGWWLKRKLSELAEAISDHAGLLAAASPAAYAELLLEFAALPRPTLSGVAMARSTNLSERIERLLNESSFRQTFTGGRRVVVSLIIPAVLIAAASLVRVKAASTPDQTTAPQAAKASANLPTPPRVATVQPHPRIVQVAVSGLGPLKQDPTPQAPSAPASAPQAAPEAPAPPMPADSSQEPAPAPSPVPHVHVDVQVPPMPPMHVQVQIPPMPHFDGRMGEFRFDEEAYAIVGDPGTKTQFHGDWDGVDRGAEVQKARKMVSGHFLLFRRDGKTYIVDDPATVSQVEVMDKALQAQSDQMRALGKQMHDAVEPFRDQMHDQQQQERDAERKARETASEIPTPDISKEMAELNAAVAALQAKQGGTISREQLGEIQRKIGEVQRRVIEAEVKVKVNVDFDMSKFNEARSKFSEQESQFGAQMGQLGSQIGQTTHENNEKIKSIVNDSLNNGKARRVN